MQEYQRLSVEVFYRYYLGWRGSDIDMNPWTRFLGGPVFWGGLCASSLEKEKRCWHWGILDVFALHYSGETVVQEIVS